MWMNRMDIDDAVWRWGAHPVMSKATKFLAAFRDEVDEHSDGWPYWKPASKAACSLMELIQEFPNTATLADVKKAISPIKAFYTRRGYAAGMKLPTL
jgi:hypothetical protein